MIKFLFSKGGNCVIYSAKVKGKYGAIHTSLFVCDYAKIFRLKFLANGFDVESLVRDPKAYIHTSRGRERG